MASLHPTHGGTPDTPGGYPRRPLPPIPPRRETGRLQSLPLPHDTGVVERGEELLTVREVARRLRVDDTTVRRWIKNGALEAITLPHRGQRQAYRIRTSTMDALVPPTATDGATGGQTS